MHKLRDSGDVEIEGDLEYFGGHLYMDWPWYIRFVKCIALIVMGRCRIPDKLNKAVGWRL